jgi:UDP-glucose:glycoprotein glucosyltransferase
VFDALALSGYPTTPGTFVYPGEQEVIPLTVHVVGDLDSEEGLSLIMDALKSMVSACYSGPQWEPRTDCQMQNDESQMRLSMIHNPASASTRDGSSVKRASMSRLFGHLISNDLVSKKSAGQILSALGLEEPLVLDEDTQAKFFEKESILSLTEGVGFAEFNLNAYYEWIKQSRLLCRELQITPGSQAIVINGRVSRLV